MIDRDPELIYQIDSERLRADVAMMRELGVSAWRGIVLDPKFRPHEEVNQKPRTEREQEAIYKAWAEYRIAYDNAQINGTELPEPPDEPEHE
jgi:hypothetical protein